MTPRTCAVVAFVRPRFRTAQVEGHFAIVDPLLVARLDAESFLGSAVRFDTFCTNVSSGATTAAMSADMRGNTDETWSRTLDWLVRNRLLAPGYGLQQR